MWSDLEYLSTSTIGQTAMTNTYTGTLCIKTSCYRLVTQNQWMVYKNKKGKNHLIANLKWWILILSKLWVIMTLKKKTEKIDTSLWETKTKLVTGDIKWLTSTAHGYNSYLWLLSLFLAYLHRMFCLKLWNTKMFMMETVKNWDEQKTVS